MSMSLTPSNEKKRPSMTLHVCAWLGFPIYAGLFILAAISAAGAPGANHGAASWNSMAWLFPTAGAIVSAIAVAKSSSWAGRVLAAIPLLGYLALIGYLVSWKLAQ